MKQDGIIEAFNELLMGFEDGGVDYDEVEEELSRLSDDEDVELVTYQACEQLWADLKDKVEFWENEEAQKWKSLEDDSE